METLIVLVGIACLVINSQADFMKSSAVATSSSSSKALEIVSSIHPFRKCRIIDNNRLFYNDRFIRFLSPIEIREVEEYKRKMNLWNIGFQEHINRELQSDLKPIEDVEEALNSFTKRVDDFNRHFGFGGFLSPAGFWKQMPTLQTPFSRSQPILDFQSTPRRLMRHLRTQVPEIPEFPNTPSFCDM